jgi:hypothetical protein
VRRRHLLDPRPKESFLQRQRRRLGRAAASELSRRNELGADWRLEASKGLLALVPGALLGIFNAPRPLVVGFLVVGALVYAFWFGFVGWHWLRVASRHGDKMYNLVTRKHLSKEYRDG